MWASSWKNVSSGVSDQDRLQPACSATEASMRLEILVTETRDITLPRQRTTKALIRLRGCADWSAPLLFAHDVRHVFICLSGCHSECCMILIFLDLFYKYSHTSCICLLSLLFYSYFTLAIWHLGTKNVSFSIYVYYGKILYNNFFGFCIS